MKGAKRGHREKCHALDQCFALDRYDTAQYKFLAAGKYGC